MRISDWSSDVCSSDLRLPPAHVTAGKHARHAGLIVDDIRRNVSARVETHPRLLDHPGLAWSEEAHGKQHQIGLELELATRNLLHLHPAVVGFHPFDADTFQRFDLAVASDRTLGDDRPVALAAFLMRG